MTSAMRWLPSDMKTWARGLSATTCRLVTRRPGSISTALPTGSKDEIGNTRADALQTAVGALQPGAGRWASAGVQTNSKRISGISAKRNIWSPWNMDLRCRIPPGLSIACAQDGIRIMQKIKN